VQAKRSFSQLLEILNSKYAGEVKKDSERTIQFVYSKYSPVEACLKKDRVLMRDMLSLVQTNLLKFYVDLKEKQKIYQFFQDYQRQQLLLDPRELQGYIEKFHGGESDAVNLIVMALVNENIDNYQEALKIWNQLRTLKGANLQEGCERTVSILKKKKDLATIK
jgi:hypothetical protein